MKPISFPLCCLVFSLSAAAQEQPLSADAAPADVASPSATPPAALEPGWVVHLHQLKATKGVDSNPSGHSVGQFILTDNPFNLAAHKGTALSFWKQPAGYLLEGIFSAEKPGWYTFVLELSVPPLSLRYNQKTNHTAGGHFYSTYSFTFNDETLAKHDLYSRKVPTRSATQKQCGYTDQQSASVYLDPGHYEVKLWFAAAGRYAVKGNPPSLYIPTDCPNSDRSFRADENVGDEIPLRILVRRPNEHVPQPALAADFSHKLGAELAQK